MADRFWPLGDGRVVTSPFGPRAGGFHAGVDFGREGGSANMPVYAIQAGTVVHAGAATGYGGPDPAGWLVIQSSDAEGGGTLEYGHIVRLPHVKPGYRVAAGERIAVINPDQRTNGGTAPHLHVSDMPGVYAPGTKQDLMPRLKGAREPGVTVPSNKPDFNEYWVKSSSFHSRGGTKVDLFLLHTQEGAGNADSLARFLANPANRVSYHYTISQDPKDGGVTVCDVVDTDYASWSALSANNRSINLCFAGSTVNWSREQWLKQSKAIDVAAYLCVQDCKLKYGIPLRVLSPPYQYAPPGISDHKYVTQFLKDGSHTDVGPNFPWDVFAKAVAKYGAEAQGSAPVAPPTPPQPTPPPKPAVKPDAPAYQYPSQTEMVTQLWEQLLGPRAKGWPQLGGRTLVDAVAEILKSKE